MLGTTVPACKQLQFTRKKCFEIHLWVVILCFLVCFTKDNFETVFLFTGTNYMSRIIEVNLSEKFSKFRMMVLLNQEE